ncbi:hypothetical protein BKA63DRAFT_544930 [Paraphoma chrysanthemicola]|nr:hypothetical protein BKA63DRAFT_544930 [Paraphoma chrysanthemicola]
MQDPTWKETRPGRWERPQSYLEKINILTRNVPNAIGGDNWAKNAVAKLDFHPSIEDPAAYLQTAWKQVRYNHPEIAAFPYNGHYVYRVGDTTSIALWVSATFSVVENTSVDELLGRIPRNEQMMCYFLQSSNEVLIYIEATLGVHSESTPEIEAAVRKRIDALKLHKPPLELTPKITSQKPGYTKRHFVRLSKTDTTALLTCCESKSLATDAVFHAALINSVAKLAPPSEEQSFMASFHSNLRVLIPEGVAPKQSPTSYTSIITTEVDVSPQTNFESYYAQLAPVYAAGYAPYLQSSSLFHTRLGEMHYSTVDSSPPKGETEGQLQPRFASLGVVDEQITKDVENGLVKVQDFWLGAETLTMRMMVHTWIWDGQLTLSVTYNESYWDRQVAAQLLDGMQDTLRELALGGLISGLAI